jgi:hypothetical protein
MAPSNAGRAIAMAQPHSDALVRSGGETSRSEPAELATEACLIRRYAEASEAESQYPQPASQSSPLGEARR